MTKFLVIVVALLNAALGYGADEKSESGETAASAPANGKKETDWGIKPIFEHARELKLTAEQMDKLQKLKSDAEAAMEKLRQDPVYIKLAAQIKEAVRVSDSRTHDSLAKERIEFIAKNGYGAVLEVPAKAKALLTAEQMAKLEEITKGTGY